MRIRRELWGVLDQALVSGVNFLTIILVARSLDPGDFGKFVLAFTLLQSAGLLQAALITRPHNVLGAARRGREYVDYTTTAAAEQVALSATLALTALAGAALAYAAGSAQWPLVLAIAAALVTWQLQEFGRRVLYTEQRLAAALANDCLSYGALAVGLVVLSRLDLLTSETAVVTLVAAMAIGAVVVGWQLRRSLTGRLDTTSLRASWHFGKWLGVAELGQWFSTHFYVYLSAAVLGSAASAALKAGQTLLGPISAFLTFVTSYLPVLFARELAASGTLAGKVRRSLATILPVVVPYCLLVSVFAEPVLERVYGAEYGQYADVVQLFAFYYVLLAFSTVTVAALSARHLTRDVFRGQAAAAMLSLAVGWALLRELGPAGGVVGMILSWAVAMAVFVRALRTPRGRTAAPDPSRVSTADEL